MKKWLVLARQQWLLIAIVVVATLVRVWQLDTHAIFFGDAGRDLLVAAQALEQRYVPLLGIPSSVPRFKQGPVAIWIEMLTMLVAGENLYLVSLVFALIGVAAVILTYEVATVWVSRRVGLVAAWLVAASPLAIAHSRMPYHTNPIPLATGFFLWMLMRLWQKQKNAIFWVAFSWAVLFQFELALLPAVLLVPYVIWRTKQKITQLMVGQVSLGLAVGLLPQIMYDMTHGFSQLGAFGAWVGYRLATAILPGTDHSFGLVNLQQTTTAFWLYAGRIISFDSTSLKLVGLLLLILSAGLAWRQWRRQKLPALIEVSWVSLIVLSGGFLIHSSPSEAYFPGLIVLLALVIGWGVIQLKSSSQVVALAIIGLMGLSSLLSIVQQSFWVSNSGNWTYGASTGEQRLVMSQIIETTNGNFVLNTIQPTREFPSYFDNYRWWVRQTGMAESDQGIRVYLEPKNSALDSYPGMTKQSFTTLDVYYYE